MADNRTREFNPDALACRASFLRHPWEVVGTPKLGARESIINEECPRCGATKVVVLNSRGMVLESHITYPSGYLAPKGTGRVDGADVRAEWLKRQRSRRRHLKAV